MKAWRVAVWAGGLMLMAPLVVMAWHIPFFIGFVLCGWAAYRATDFVRLRTKQLDRALLAFDLADLLELGVPLAEAAGRLAQEQRQNWRTSSTRLARYWSRVPEALARGSSLGQCVGPSKIFPRVWGAALAHAERAEQLPAVLRRLGRLEMLDLEQRRDHLLLPKIILILLLGTLYFLCQHVWPSFFNIYKGAGVPAPAAITWLSSAVSHLRNGPPLLLVLVVLIMMASKVGWRFNRPRLLAEQARLAEALACGADLGLSVPGMLDLASTSCGEPYRKELKQLAGQSGDSLAQALSRRQLLPQHWLWFVGQGEGRGQLAEALHKTSCELHSEQQRVAHRWHILASQAAIAGLGVLVGLACVATMSCILDLNRLLVEVL